MKIITISKKGEIFIEDNFSNNKEKINAADCLSKYLFCEVDFEDDLTFGTFFKLILKEKDFFNTVFYQELNGKPLEEFEIDLEKRVKRKKGEQKIQLIEISKIFQFLSFDGGKTINMFPICSGIKDDSDDFSIYTPISFCSVAELKNAPIYVNRIMEVVKDNQVNDISDVEDEIDDDEIEDDDIGVIKVIVNMTLYEVIQSIFCEISYYHTQKERDAAKQDMEQDIVYDDKVEILEFELQKLVDKEDFEKASAVKKEIDKLKAVKNKNKK